MSSSEDGLEDVEICIIRPLGDDTRWVSFDNAELLEIVRTRVVTV